MTEIFDRLQTGLTKNDYEKIGLRVVSLFEISIDDLEGLGRAFCKILCALAGLSSPNDSEAVVLLTLSECSNKQEDTLCQAKAGTGEEVKS